VNELKNDIEATAVARLTERRFAVVSRRDPRTPYVKAVEKLWPTPVVTACAEATGSRPPPLLATFVELGGRNPELVRKELPL